MKKLLLFFLLFVSVITSRAQYNAGWDNAINFGSKGVRMMDMRYVNGDLYFFAELFGKYEFAGTQYTSLTYYYDQVYGKITSTGQQVLLRRFNAGAEYGLYGTAIADGRILADGGLVAYKSSIAYTSSGELAVDYGNGVISQLTGLELLKIDNTGTAQWIKPINPGSNAVYGRSGVTSATLHALQENGQGNIYIMVEANNLNSAGNAYAARLIKLNSAGNEVWHYEMSNATSGITSLNNMPRQFVDNDGNVTFFILATKANILFNGESLPLEAPSPSSLYNWLVHLDANGQKKWSHSTSMAAGSASWYLGVNPQNGEVYYNYNYTKTTNTPPVLAPFSTLPNLSPVPQYYIWNGIISFNKQGGIIRSKTNYPVNNYLKKLAVADNGRMLVYGQTNSGQTLTAGNHSITESGVYHAAMEVDENFEPISVFKTPEISAIALSGNKFAIGAIFKTALTFGSTTLTPTHIDGNVTKSDVLIAQGNLNSIPFALLPVKLSKFTVSKQINQVLIHWETLSEIGNDKFEIEHSTNGTDFIKIGEVKGNGTSQKLNTYSFRDLSPENGVNYYRLKQIDTNGEFDYSDVRFLKFDLEDATFSIYPNPATSEIHILGIKTGTFETSIYDLGGKLLIKSFGKNGFYILPESLNSGLYVVKIQQGAQGFSKIIMVNK